MYKLNILSLLAIGLVLGMSSCTKDNKDNKADQEKVETVITDFMFASSSFELAQSAMNASAQQEDGLNGFAGPEIAKDRNCGEIGFAADPDNFFPAELSINYGTGCELEGHTLSGRLTASFNGFLFEPNKSIQLGFDVFGIDDFSVNGDYTLSNQGFNNNGQQIWEHLVQDGRITGSQGFSVNYGTTTSSTQTEGQLTHWWNAGNSGITDDVWEIIQSSTFENPFGEIFTISTTTPLVKNAVCPWPISGVLAFNGETLEHTIEVDFGIDRCDEIATVTYGDISFEISLK